MKFYKEVNCCPCCVIYLIIILCKCIISCFKMMNKIKFFKKYVIFVHTSFVSHGYYMHLNLCAVKLWFMQYKFVTISMEMGLHNLKMTSYTHLFPHSFGFTLLRITWVWRGLKSKQCWTSFSWKFFIYHGKIVWNHAL